MSPQPAVGGPGHSVSFLLSQLGYTTSRRFKQALASLGIEPRQFAMLRFIAMAEGQSQQAIASALQIPPSRMVSLVDDLEERGLLERRQDPADRRARALHLTRAGRRLLEQAWKVAMETEQVTVQGWSDKDRQKLLELLNRLAAQHGLTLGVHPGLVDGE